MSPLGDTHVETRIVDKDYHVGRECLYIALALGNLPEYGFQIAQHLRDSEKRCFLIVFIDISLSADLRHTVAAPEPELGSGVFRGDSAHQIASVQVAARLSRNKIVLHRCMFIR